MKNKNAKFHLVVCVYMLNKKEFPQKILSSFISCPIFVDSRKSVKDNEKINNVFDKLFTDYLF